MVTTSTRQLSRLTRRVTISLLYRRISPTKSGSSILTRMISRRSNTSRRSWSRVSPNLALGREMRHLLPGSSFDDHNVSGLKVRRFHNAMPAMYDGLVRLPTAMPGLETLLAEFAAFPDGRNDDQVDAVCNVAAHREVHRFVARICSASGLAVSGRFRASSRRPRRSRGTRNSTTVGGNSVTNAFNQLI